MIAAQIDQGIQPMSNAIGMLMPWLLAAYLCGALPWSVWLGHLLYATDPRDQRDANPGAANSFRSAGWRLGVVVLILDFFKAFIPVAAARWLGNLPDEQLFWVALAPTLGHAFSVFLRFRGGRGITVMFGVWAGLTLYRIPLLLGAVAILAVMLFRNDECRTLAIPLALLAFLVLTHGPGWMLLLAAAQLLVLILKIAVFFTRQYLHYRDRPSR
jgi:glycerol-3-phosphate acyltransferase PlsY